MPVVLRGEVLVPTSTALLYPAHELKTEKAFVRTQLNTEHRAFPVLNFPAPEIVPFIYFSSWFCYFYSYCVLSLAQCKTHSYKLALCEWLWLLANVEVRKLAQNLLRYFLRTCVCKFWKS